MNHHPAPEVDRQDRRTPGTPTPKADRTFASPCPSSYLRSMFPIHSGAILVCHEVRLRDARATRLCREIIEAQNTEVRQMKTLLAE